MGVGLSLALASLKVLWEVHSRNQETEREDEKTPPTNYEVLHSCSSVSVWCSGTVKVLFALKSEDAKNGESMNWWDFIEKGTATREFSNSKAGKNCTSFYNRVALSAS